MMNVFSEFNVSNNGFYSEFLVTETLHYPFLGSEYIIYSDFNSVFV